MLKRIPVLLAALALLATACPEEEPDEPAAPEEPAEVPEELVEDELPEEAPEVDLPEGVAATVNDEEIPSADVESQVDAALEAQPELAEELEGEEREAMLSQFRAQVLSQRIQGEVILDGADDLGVSPTEDEVDSAREELAAELGGEDELEQAVAQAGLDEAALELQLRSMAAVDSVGAALREEEDAEELLPEGAPEDAGEEEVEQLLFQQWFMGELAEADVLVDPAYGQWEPQAGQVVPAQQAPVPLPEGEGQ